MTLIPSSSHGGGGGSALTVSDGSTTVPNVSEVNFSGATVVDEGGGEAGVEVAGGGLPTGWTQDMADPSTLSTNGGSLDVGAGGGIVLDDGAGDSVSITPGGFNVIANGLGTDVFDAGQGVKSAPPGGEGGQPAFKALGDNGATVALDAGGLDVTNVGLFNTGELGGQSVIASGSNFAVGNADASSALIVTNGSTAADGRVGFFGTSAAAQPQVPATPLPQDIVDALVALGLVSQSA